MRIGQHLIIAKDKGLGKDSMIHFLLNDISLEEQELILKSRKSELDNDYIERLEKKLYDSTYKELLSMIIKSGYVVEDVI